MAVYWTYAPAPLALWNTADIALGSIPTPRTQITEQEWKDALALQNSGYELVDGAGHKPVGQLPTVSLEVQREAMVVERLYFHDACRATSYGGSSNVYDTLVARLTSLTDLQKARYADITVFRRNMPEMATYFQDAGGGVNLTDTQLDTLFNDAIVLAEA